MFLGEKIKNKCIHNLFIDDHHHIHWWTLRSAIIFPQWWWSSSWRWNENGPLRKRWITRRKQILGTNDMRKAVTIFVSAVRFFLSFSVHILFFFFATKLQTGATIIIDNELLWLANVAAADIIIIIIMILAFKQILILMMMMFDNQKTKIKSTRKKIE